MVDFVEVPFGCGIGKTKDGAEYLRIHYQADPNKRDQTWIVSGRASMGAREWDREMEMREDIWDGLPVFPEYNEASGTGWHTPIEFRVNKIPLQLEKAYYFGGWDAGQTLRPAFTLSQLVFGDTRDVCQLQGLLEVTTEYALPMETFAPLVAQAINKHYSEIFDRIQHGGDETIRNRSGSRGESAQQVAMEHGFYIQPLSNQWHPRKSAVSKFLNKQIDEHTPAMVICGQLMPMLRKGFQGAYHLRSKDGMTGPDVKVDIPEKNVYSHVHDSWQANCMMAAEEMDRKGAGQVTELNMSF